MAERGVRRRGRGFGARGGFKRHHQTDGSAAAAVEDDFESPEIKTLRQKHGEHVPTVLAVFPDWDDESVLFALGEAGGSVELAISRIAEGQAEQWGSVKAKKQPKKDVATDSTAGAYDNSAGGFSSAPARGAFAGGRGRGRGDFRGGRGGMRGGARGGRGGAVSSRPPANGAGGAGEAHVTELTDISANPDGTVTATTVTETEAAGAQEVSVKETVTDAAGTTVQVEETISIVEKPTAAVSTNGKAALTRPAPAAGKRSWAQIARPPSPKPQPAPVPKPQEAKPGPPPEPEAPAAVIAAVTEETTPVVIIEAEIPAPSAAAAQDPWSSTPAAANVEVPEVQASEPAPLGVGEGWADSVLAQEATQPSAASVEEQIALAAQHQRAEEAAPPAGIDPAGSLDVHTPAAHELPSQQTVFGQQAPTQNAERMAPPGLNKRAGASRGKQDAAVVMPGSTPDIEKMGVQFGSLNLFGNVPSQAPEAPSAPQQALYETPSVQDLMSSHAQNQQQQEQPAPTEQTYQQQPQQQVSATQYDYQQQTQYAQPEAQKQPASAYPGVLDRFGTATQQQQQPAASAYASRYQPFGQSAQQQQDPFASITSQYAQNANASQQSSIPSLGGADSISPYYSSQQAMPQSQQAVQSTPSPAPASVRDTGSASAQQTAQSAYGGFTSALGQNGQQQQQAQQHQGYQSDYSNVYGMPDPMRSLQNYYSQYDQASQPTRTGATDDLSSKLGASTATSAAGLNQQSAQQQQQYPPNMMHYGYPYYPPYGMPHNYGSHGMNPNYPGYGSHHSPYAPYGGYGGNRGGYPGAGGANHTPHSSAGGGGNAYGRGAGAYGNAAPGLGGNAGQHSTSYGQGAYGSFDTARGSNQGVNAGSNQGGQSQGQQDRGSHNKDVFGDRFFGGGY